MTIIKGSSTPSYFEFNPKVIPYQYRVIYDIKKRFTYDDGPNYVLLSGSVGSAKSCLLAWLTINHCLEFRGARALIARKALPDLKSTLFQKIVEMLAGSSLVEGVDYVINLSATSIKFKNGSEIISRSWSDRKYTKLRSLELSFIAVEELTENSTGDWGFFNELIARLGRLPHIIENIFIAATNPDDPSHPAYDFFIKDSKKVGYYAVKGEGKIHTYYSLTSHNPFLPKWYIKELMKKYDPKMILRMLKGIWLYISTDIIYYQYDKEKHFVLKDTKPKKDLPLRITFDFNIQKGKPMSSALFQFNPYANNSSKHDRTFTFIDEVAVEGARTGDAMDEWQGKGYFDLEHNPIIIIHGDASGSYNDTRSKGSDYDIIEDYLANYKRKDGRKLTYEPLILKANPPIRERHNHTNGALQNANKEISVAIDKRCNTIDSGFSNTRLKEKAGYIEDQSTEGQDISTAVTYGIHYCLNYCLDDDDDIEFS